MSRAGLSLRAAVAATLALLAAGGVHCSGDGYGAAETIACPGHDVFLKSVSPYLERRCGTLDCHGAEARPMRFYGALGLRHADGFDVPGGAATTTAELESNFASVCGLDPDPMSDATKDRGAAAEKLLIVNKARGLERHKGGAVVNKQDPGDRCILGWLRVAPPDQVDADCKTAMKSLD